jgi:hypothetical protein
MEVDKCEELICFMAAGESISLQEITYQGEVRYRVSVGNLFGSQSVHIRHWRDAISSVAKIQTLLWSNVEREDFGQKKKQLKAENLPGFLLKEPRPGVE